MTQEHDFAQEEIAPYRLITIIPAEGWDARYSLENGKSFFAALACWALIEHTGGWREVIGMQGEGADVHPAHGAKNFRGYHTRHQIITPGQLPPTEENTP